ncbi:MAG: hypothetical protein KC940_18485 [Candidatus Omnitrophica bacterium]|nr:hypothetical protein [Candidatus Omnitrophota bacterium]MCB9770748.1 hypothetical protein [Candidatus Omnitrophota bacterium]
MSTLHIENVPGDLHDRLRELAERRKRSLDSEVLDLLTQAVRDAEFRQSQKEILAGLRQKRFQPGAEVPDSLDLLREDRAR